MFDFAMRNAHGKRKTPVDEGYAWVILAACTFIYMFIAGNAKSFGILYFEFLEYYGSGAGNTAWISSVQYFLFFGSGPISNYLAEKFSFRSVMMTGGFTVSIAFFISAFVNRLEWMFLTLGFMLGAGYGLIFAPCTTIISFYFNKWRAFANGIVISGSGIGSFIFPYLYRTLIDFYGIKGAMMLIGGLLLHVCPLAALLRYPHQLYLKRLEQERKQRESKQAQEDEARDLLDSKTVNQKRKCQCFIFDFSLFKMSLYTTYIVSFTINITGYSANFSVFPTHVKSLGFSRQQVTIALSMIGVTEVFSRPFFGWFSDMKIIEKKTILIIAAVVSGTVAIIIPFFSEFSIMIVYGCVVGIFPGAFWSLMSVILLECVELPRLPSAFGLMSLCLAVGNMFSQTLAGWIKDLTGTWAASFRFIGACNLIAGLILIGQPLIQRFWCCDEQEVIDKVPECTREENVQNTGKEHHIKLNGYNSPVRNNMTDDVRHQDDENRSLCSQASDIHVRSIEMKQAPVASMTDI